MAVGRRLREEVIMMQFHHVEFQCSLLVQMSVIGHDQRQLQVLWEFSPSYMLNNDALLLTGQHFV
jgi:hypothetical protein